MGQQQLLLIVLGIIIAAIAVAVGLTLFSVNSIKANRDAVTIDCVTLATLAQEYYKKPKSFGGGGRSFSGWQIPINLTSTADGTFQATVSPAEVLIVGTGVEKELNGDEIKIQVRVYADSYTILSGDGDGGSGGGGEGEGGGGDGDGDDDGGGGNGDDDDDD